nr:MAG: hypothetical protein 1 [Leviviridae sp.]
MGYIKDGQGVIKRQKPHLVHYGKITDNILPGNGHDLFIKSLTVNGGVLNKVTSSTSSTSRHAFNWQLDRIRDPEDPIYDHRTVDGKPTYGSLAAQLLADTNPSRPVVDLPVFIAELRDFPQLLKHEGNLIRKAASLNLSYQFGIKPMVSDLLKLIDFSDEVNKREKELNALARSGLRRKRQLWSGTKTATGSTQYFQSLDFLRKGKIDYNTHTKFWGYVEWYPTYPYKFMFADRRSLARKAVLGLTVDFATAWELMPWSWLIDWCSNAGDILISSRNIIDATHSVPLIMKETKTTGSCKDIADDVSAFTFVNHRKERDRTNATLSAQLPILTARQFSILGSIGVTRRLPRR